MEIKSELEYQAALERLNVVFMADQSTPEGKEAALLADAIEAYEDIHHPIGPPSDVPMIESIISRAGNTLKLRFLDGSVGELETPSLLASGASVSEGGLRVISDTPVDPILLWQAAKFL